MLTHKSKVFLLVLYRVFNQRVSGFLSVEQIKLEVLLIKSLETVLKDLSVNNKILTCSYTLCIVFLNLAWLLSLIRQSYGIV